MSQHFVCYTYTGAYSTVSLAWPGNRVCFIPSLLVSVFWRLSRMLNSRLLPWQGPQVDPRLIASNHLMQLSTLELEQAIRQELDDNPALEMVERTTCSFCGAPLSCGLCRGCQGAGSLLDSGPGDAGQMGSQEDEAFDPLSGVAVPVTLPEYLLAQLRLVVDEQ